mgnify:CR=1 FL=1
MLFRSLQTAAMPDDKSLGKRILGLFVESVDETKPAADPETEGTPSAADEIAALLAAMNSLTTSMSRDERKYSSPPEHV